MAPVIVARDECIVVGIRAVLDACAESTGTLWKNEFLPRHGEIPNAANTYYGVFSIVPGGDARGRCEYVAGVLSDLEHIPLGMVGWVIPGGSYAEAEAKGLPGIGQVCQALLTEWLPGSGYTLVESPMFACTTSEQPDAPDAVWKVHIPVSTPEQLEEMKKWVV